MQQTSVIPAQLKKRFQEESTTWMENSNKHVLTRHPQDQEERDSRVGNLDLRKMERFLYT